jgi:hypothetical protein
VHARGKRPVEFVQSFAAQAFDVRERARSLGDETLDVDLLTPRSERLQIHRAASEHVHGAVVIEPAEMMKRDADLQNALIQPPDIARFGAPQNFERFVLLEIFSAVELCDPFKKGRWRRLETGRHEWTSVLADDDLAA